MDPVRSSPGSVLFTTYNLLDLGADDSASGADHYRAVVESIRALRTDVLAVQEICAPGIPAAGQLLVQLADDTGLRCLVPRPGGDAAPSSPRRSRSEPPVSSCQTEVRGTPRAAPPAPRRPG